MFKNIKTLIIDIIKNQKMFILIILPIWIVPQFLFKPNYKYSIEGIILNIFVLFLLYGFNAIRYGKIYNAVYKFVTDNKRNDNISIVYPASFALNVFWYLMSTLLIVGFVNNSTNLIPNIITYYMIIFLMFIINIVAIQGNDYYNKFIKSLNKDFTNNLEV